MYGSRQGRHNVILTSPQMSEYTSEKGGLGQQRISVPPLPLSFIPKIKNYVKAPPAAHTKCHSFEHVP